MQIFLFHCIKIHAEITGKPQLKIEVHTFTSTPKYDAFLMHYLNIDLFYILFTQNDG